MKETCNESHKILKKYRKSEQRNSPSICISNINTPHSQSYSRPSIIPIKTLIIFYRYLEINTKIYLESWTSPKYLRYLCVKITIFKASNIFKTCSETRQDGIESKHPKSQGNR